MATMKETRHELLKAKWKEIISELHEYMRYYNYDRIKKKLNYKSPVTYRLLEQAA